MGPPGRKGRTPAIKCLMMSGILPPWLLGCKSPVVKVGGKRKVQIEAIQWEKIKRLAWAGRALISLAQDCPPAVNTRRHSLNSLPAPPACVWRYPSINHCESSDSGWCLTTQYGCWPARTASSASVWQTRANCLADSCRWAQWRGTPPTTVHMRTALFAASL